MKNYSPPSLSAPIQEQTHLATRFCKWLVFRKLSSLAFGSFSIEYGNKSYHFGVPAEKKITVSLTVHNPVFFLLIVRQGHLGFAESYGRGYCSVSDLTQLLIIMAHNKTVSDLAEKGISWFNGKVQYLRYLLQKNSKKGAKQNILAHYDLGNELFELFLDPLMQYSSGVFDHAHPTLTEAQLHKCQIVGQQLNLKSTDHVLEIGSGWGGLAIYLASNYGCTVTSVTLSKEQHAYATNAVAKAGLSEHVTILICDYRDIVGIYDKIVSIEMIEAVGHQYYSHFFRQCNALLKPGGLLFMQAILIADHAYEQARKSVDFIKKYIFPGSNIPCLNILNEKANVHQFHLQHYTDTTPSYVKTLASWQDSFSANSQTLSAMGYDRYFQNIWHFYFSYCQAGFTSKHIRDAHLLFAKPIRTIE